MPLLTRIRHVLFWSGLSKSEYKLVEQRINADNREKLASASCIIGVMLIFMLFLSCLEESIYQSQKAYLVGLAVAVVLYVLSQIGKHHSWVTSLGIYLFMDFALILGIYQGVVTSPEQQTASFMALVLAVPFWFGMIPSRMIAHIYLFTGIFIVCVLKIKTGYVQTADIVNAILYSTASVIISTYATCVKGKRFYAEHLTEQMGKTDVLTGLGNRTAFFEHEKSYEGKNLPADFTLWYMDVNELKTINDMLGHYTGDEVLKGAADCIAAIYGDAGTCYRTGGDEFIVIGRADEQTREELNKRFDVLVKSWRGPADRPLRISCGCASAYELENASIYDVASLAESRLYASKTKYYESVGLNRRGHDDAYGALCQSYIKIMKVNLTDDTYKTIRSDIDDGFLQENGSTCFSQWMTTFRKMNYVHRRDEKSYSVLTDIERLREHFRAGNRTMHVFYRRKHNGEYRAVMTELMAAREYTDNVQIVYLYVKDIDKSAK